MAADCWPLLKEFIVGLLGPDVLSALDPPSQQFQATFNSPQTPSDVALQYLEHFNNFRKAVSPMPRWRGATSVQWTVACDAMVFRPGIPDQLMHYFTRKRPACVLCSLHVCHYNYFYAAFNAPCVGHKDDESQPPCVLLFYFARKTAFNQSQWLHCRPCQKPLASVCDIDFSIPSDLWPWPIHMRQVYVPLPTYSKNVALPAFVHCMLFLQ